MSGSAYDLVFDMARTVVQDPAGKATLQEETSSWTCRHDRDLTGFVDGSENPPRLDAPQLCAPTLRHTRGREMPYEDHGTVRRNFLCPFRRQKLGYCAENTQEYLTISQVVYFNYFMAVCEVWCESLLGTQFPAKTRCILSFRYSRVLNKAEYRKW